MKNPISVLAILLLLSACGGLKKPTAPSGTLDSTLASSFVSSRSSTLFAYGNAFDNDLAGVSTGQVGLGTARENDRAVDMASCTTKSAFTDGSDGDGIPLNGVATFACNDLTFSSEIKISINGSATVTDKDDTKKAPLGGFKTSLPKLAIKLSGTGFSADTTSSGMVDLTDNGTSYTYASELISEFSFLVASTNTSGKVGYWFDMKLTPTDQASPKSGGTITDATIWFVSSVKNAEYTLKGTCSGLTYGVASRGAIFKSGTCEFVAGGPDKLEVTFTSGTPSWKFKGTALSAK